MPEILNNTDLSADDSQAPVDGMIILEFSDDNTAAYITITQAAYGGHEVTLKDVENELKLQDIVYGININIAEEIINNKQFNRKFCVARGTLPVNGVDGSVRFYFKPSSKLLPREKKFGEVDYRDLGLVTNILTDTPIAKIEPPKDGVDGFDVFGNTIPFIKGKEIKYSLGAGTGMSEDETTVVALMDGNLRWAKDRFVVEETLVIGENVDVSTGNIEFIGNIVIKGEVRENFTVISKKNISVGSFITGATLIAEGDITIGLGSVNSSISAKGNVKLNFCENSKIECDGDISVQSCILSEIFCGGIINATSGKGAIIGGKYTALQGFNANTLGSEVFAKTSITLGNGAVLAEERLTLEERIQEHETSIKKLMQITELLQEHKRKFGPLPAERETMLASAIRTRFTFQREINTINMRIKAIDEALKQNNDLKVVVRNKIWPGVFIRIGTGSIQIREAYVRTVARQSVEGGIELVPIT